MEARNQATWGGRFHSLPSQKMLHFGESVSFDSRLAPYDLACSRAHASMLAHVGILTRREVEDILKGLDTIEASIRSGTFEWKIEFEDVHMNIEQALKQLTPAGAKVHTGRSRNDQVATDIHLFVKDACNRLIEMLRSCALAFVDHAAQHVSTPAPSYTHLQRAQPITLAHYCLAWVEMLHRDILEFEQTWHVANHCPLGSGALAGTTLHIDRAFAAKALGFVDADGEALLTTNSLDAVGNRDTLLKFAFACAQSATHFSRLAEDWILWSTSEYRFIHLPDDYTTGSSLMPQKRNPDALELTRGKCARIHGNLHTLLTLLKAQPLTYNRDLQEDKPAVFDSFDQLSMIADLMGDLIPKVVFRTNRLKEACADPMLYATDLADYLVREGLPFRDAHHLVGKLVAKAEELGLPLDQIPLQERIAISPYFDLRIDGLFGFDQSIARRNQPGMPSPECNASRIADWRQILTPSST